MALLWFPIIFREGHRASPPLRGAQVEIQFMIQTLSSSPQIAFTNGHLITLQ